MRHHLQPLFMPGSIAVVATLDFPEAGKQILDILVRFGFPGKLYGVNLNGTQLRDVVYVNSVADLPESVHLAVVAVAAESLLEVARLCAGRGIRSMIVISGSDASDPEGATQERELARIAGEADMKLIGPGTAGVMNVGRHFAAMSSSGMEFDELRAGGISVISQSSAVGAIAVALARQTGVGIDYWAHVGNGAMLEAHDLADFLVDHPGTRAVGIYTENIRDGRGLLTVADAFVRARKPLIVLKGGVTITSRGSAKTHTSALADNARAWQGAAYARGMVLTDSIGQFFNMVATFGTVGRLRGGRTAILTSSGSAAVLAADAARRYGLVLGSLSDRTHGWLLKTLPFVRPDQPFNMTGVFGRPGFLREAMTQLAADPAVDIMLLVVEAHENCAVRILQEVIDVNTLGRKPILVSWPACPELIIREFWEADVPCFPDTAVAVEVMARMAEYVDRLPLLAAAMGERAERRTNVSQSGVRQLAALSDQGLPRRLPQVSELSQSFLSERQGKEILSSWGVQILPGKLASSAHEAREIAESIGYPVAMKIESPDIVHKTEAGGVRLRLATGEEVHQAFEELSAIGEFVPGARVTGVFVEKMAGKGIELLVGASRDRDFGLCLTLGLGGIWTEILQDFAVRPLPISPWDADDMLRSLRGHALLCGARGMQVDRDAVVTTVVAIAEFAQAVGDDLVALDVNPLLVEIEGAYALDVRIQLRDKSMAHTEGSC